MMRRRGNRPTIRLRLGNKLSVIYMCDLPPLIRCHLITPADRVHPPLPRYHNKLDPIIIDLDRLLRPLPSCQLPDKVRPRMCWNHMLSPSQQNGKKGN